MPSVARLVTCAVIGTAIFGCSSPSSEKAAEKPVTMPSASVETGDGPPESELAKVLDVPLYPGARVTRNKVAKAGEENRYHVTLETPDPVAKVAEFYQAHGLPSMVHEGKGQAIGETKHGNNALIDIDRKGDKTEILIRVSAGAKHA